MSIRLKGEKSLTKDLPRKGKVKAALRTLQLLKKIPHRLVPSRSLILRS